IATLFPYTTLFRSEGRLAKRMIVPLNTRDFTGFAPDARRDVNVLAHWLFTACSPPRHRTRMSRDFLNLKCPWVSHGLCLKLGYSQNHLAVAGGYEVKIVQIEKAAHPPATARWF